MFYKEIYNRKILVEQLNVKQRRHNIPVVLSKEEVKSIIDSTRNIKYKAILALIYSSGLRIGELLELRIKDIDSKRMTVYIKQAKGKKDRYTMLSEKTLSLLREYFINEKPKYYLFEGL